MAAAGPAIWSLLTVRRPNCYCISYLGTPKVEFNDTMRGTIFLLLVYFAHFCISSTVTETSGKFSISLENNSCKDEEIGKKAIASDVLIPLG